MMKRRALLSAVFLFLCIARCCAWQIDDYQITVDINRDSSITVTEQILADFSDKPKHGIMRNLPIRYQDETGKGLNVHFQILGVYDEGGAPWQYSTSYSGAYMVLKIGSPSVTHAAKKAFVIKYRVTGAILFLKDHDELFWNAVGTEWDASINNVAVTIRLPGPVQREALSTASFSGGSGSRASTVATQVLDERTILFTGGGYKPYEGVTIVVGWPKGMIEPGDGRNEGTRSVRFLFLIPLAIPAIVFFIMFSAWKRSGRDPKLEKSVVVAYTVPEGLTPAEMGTLIDDKIDMRDVSSTIIDLAVRGYLRIVKRDAMFFQKRFSFELLKDYAQEGSLSMFEKTILGGIFASAPVGTTVALDDLENTFYQKLPRIKSEVFDSLMKKGFYGRNPEKTVLFYRAIGIIVTVAAVMTLALIPLGAALGISAIIILSFATYMPAKTRRGMDVYGKVAGFEEFLMRTEKDKIRFEERQGIFEKMLPYALCLGIAGKWAKAFDGLYTRPPGWFDSDMRDGFTIQGLMHDLNRSMSSMNQSLSSAPRSVSSGGGFGGGGSSGGGFGGGGGSSW